jgi:hypothetical protein
MIRSPRKPGGGAADLEGWFSAFLRDAQRASDGRPPTLRSWQELAEAWWIARALREAGGNRSAAARTLGIGRRTLYAKMEKLGIQPVWSIRAQMGETTPEEDQDSGGTSATMERGRA